MSVCIFGKNPDTGAPNMAAAIGHTNPNPLPIRGPLWFDARDYGLSASNADNGPAIQAAHDAAQAALAAINGVFFSGITPAATVYIPSAKTPYTVKTPVFIEGSSIEIRGDGTGTQLVTTNGYGYPVFINGIYRVGSGNVPNATYRPDLWNSGTPYLDSSVVTAAGQKWGFTANADAWIVSQASVLSHGGPSPTYSGLPDNWLNTQQFTVEFAVSGPSGASMPSGINLFGVGAPGPLTATGAGVWYVTTSATNTYRLTLYTQAARFGPFATHVFTFTSGAATGVQRISFQVDLVAGAVTAFVNGSQVAVTTVSGALTANMNLNENQYFPFVLNSNGDGTPGASGVNWSLYGFCISRSLRYANLAAGQAQAPHPQLTGTSTKGSGTLTLTVPGSPTGGTYTVTIGGVTSGAISATASTSALQSALQAMSSVGSGNILVTASTTSHGTLQYSLTTASGYSLTGSPGMCNGASLTGAAPSDLYRYYPGQSGYSAMQDPYGLGYFGFTENPTVPPAPRHLTVNCGGVVGSGQFSDALLFNTNSSLAIANANRFTDLVLKSSGTYGVSIVLGHVLNTVFNNVTMIQLGGIYGAPTSRSGRIIHLQFNNCYFSGNDSNFFGDSCTLTMDHISFNVNNRYSLRLDLAARCR